MTNPALSASAARRRIAELECAVERLQLELSEMRARATPDGFSWLIVEGADSTTAAASFRFINSEISDLVSIIIPAYNASQFIERSVCSVWDQTLSRDRIEIIVADDGSQDDTRARVVALAQRSPVRMQIVTHPQNGNRGVAATRNLACAHAHGALLALLDADDAFLPERLTAADNFFRIHPETMALCSLGRNVDAQGNPIVGYNGSETAGQWRGLADRLEPPFAFDGLWQADPIANSSLTIRREAFSRVGGFPAVMAHQAEDWLLVLKLSLLAPLPCLEEELFLYTHHPGAYTHAYHAGNLRDGARLELFYHLVHWMLTQPELDERARHFFRREYPRVLAAHHRLFPVIRDFALRHGPTAPSLSDFEDYLARNMAELESLRRVVQTRVEETRRWRREAQALRKILSWPETTSSP